MIAFYLVFAMFIWTIIGAPLQSNVSHNPVNFQPPNFDRNHQLPNFDRNHQPPNFDRNRACAMCYCDNTKPANNFVYMPSKLNQNIICRECCRINALPQFTQPCSTNWTNEEDDDDKISANAIGSLLG